LLGKFYSGKAGPEGVMLKVGDVVSFASDADTNPTAAATGGVGWRICLAAAGTACEDLDTQCASWAKTHDCNAEYQFTVNGASGDHFLKNFCRASCTSCTPLPANANCRDQSPEKCPALVKDYSCPDRYRINGVEMALADFCPKSCFACGADGKHANGASSNGLIQPAAAGTSGTSSGEDEDDLTATPIFWGCVIALVICVFACLGAGFAQLTSMGTHGGVKPPASNIGAV